MKSKWDNKDYGLGEKDPVFFDDEGDEPGSKKKQTAEAIDDIQDVLDEHDEAIESLRVQINILKKHDEDNKKEIKNLKKWVKSFADLHAKLQAELEQMRIASNITQPLVFKRNTIIEGK